MVDSIHINSTHSFLRCKSRICSLLPITCCSFTSISLSKAAILSVFSSSTIYGSNYSIVWYLFLIIFIRSKEYITYQQLIFLMIQMRHVRFKITDFLLQFFHLIFKLQLLSLHRSVAIQCLVQFSH